jgi:DNA-binding MarR family transcriptional regulator
MPELDLISEIIELDRQAHRLIRRHSFHAWMELNLTVPQLKSLFFISNQRGTNPRKLAAALGVTPPNVTGIVDRLVEQGLLVRRGNPEDRRVLVLQATEKGEAILSDLRERRTSNMREILTRLSVEELSYLVKGLSALIKAAQAYEEESKDEYDRSQESEQEVRPLHSDR